MKKLYAALLLASTLFTAACDKKKEEAKPVNTIVNLTAVLNGAQQYKPNASTATGTFEGTFNRDTRELSYVITFQGMNPTLGHFHKGAPATEGGVKVNFPQYSTSPITDKTILTAENAELLLTGQFYANLHGPAPYQAGEIRGDIKIKQ